MDKDAPALHPELVDIDSLTLDPKNARLHSARNLDVIGYSLGKYQQVKAIVVSRRTRKVIAGNGTLTKAITMGATQIVVSWAHKVVDPETGELREMTEAEEDELGVLDNRSAELASWDTSRLAETIGESPTLDWSAAGWAAGDFEPFDVEWPLTEVSTVSEHDREAAGNCDDPPVEPPIPDVPAEPVTKLGDVIQLGPHVLHCADCMDVMAGLTDNSVDAIVTDPPYGLSPDGRARTWDDIEALRAEGKSGPSGGMMGKAWDSGVPGVTWARECLRVLKPGGHLIAASATRTVHRLTCAVEDSGFEIRDQIGWLYWQGFPKSMNVAKAVDATVRFGGSGSQQLRARDGNEVGEIGTNMHGYAGHGSAQGKSDPVESEDAKAWVGWGTALKPSFEPFVFARKPLSEGTVAANVLKWGTGAINIDAGRHADGDKSWPGPTEVITDRVWTPDDASSSFKLKPDGNVYSTHNLGRWPANIYHCPKPARRERNAGCDDLRKEDGFESTGRVEGSAGSKHARAGRTADGMGNFHATVKPVRLMAQLLRLVTPPGGVVLEPFGGSGTTAVAAAGLDCSVIIAEREPGYCDIIRARVEWSLDPKSDTPARRTPARDGDKRQARRRVQTLQDNGTLPRPEDVTCVDCKAKPGREYDHHLGYGAEHHEDVEALCAGCHHAREADRAAGSPEAG